MTVKLSTDAVKTRILTLLRHSGHCGVL